MPGTSPTWHEVGDKIRNPSLVYGMNFDEESGEMSASEKEQIRLEVEEEKHHPKGEVPKLFP